MYISMVIYKYTNIFVIYKYDVLRSMSVVQIESEFSKL